MVLSRRTFIKTAAVAGAGAAVGGTAHADLVSLARPASLLLEGPKPKFPNIQHVVVMMMENRSADHFLGWWGDREDVRFDASTTLPGRDTFDFGIGGEANWAGHPYVDPGHSHGTGRRQILDSDGDGVPDGWSTTEDGSDRPGSGTDRYASSYYTAADLPVIDRIVRDFTSFDRYFTSWMGNTYPNRYYMHSAQAHGIDNNDFPPQMADQDNPQWALGWDWPTLWDQLSARGVTWKYYYSNLPVIALWGPRYVANARPITEYYADCAAGTLPQVAFVDPFFVAPEGLANDDHPHADIRLGQEFYSDVTTAFMRSPNWAKGAMFINYDEWGGFFDHVVPPAVDSTVDPYGAYGPGQVPDYTVLGPHTTGPNDFGLFGFRTPAFLLSPYARNTGTNRRAPADSRPPRAQGRGNGKHTEPEITVDRTLSSTQDHVSILAFICENWGLAPTGQWDPGRSRHATGTMRDAFDPTIADPDHPGDPEVDVAAYEYVAPPEARTTGLPIPESSVSDLWVMADWIEAQGYRVNTRFADALPYRR